MAFLQHVRNGFAQEDALGLHGETAFGVVVGERHAFDQNRFGAGGGAVFVEKFADDLIVFFRVLAFGEADVFGGEPMADSVAGYDLFAGFGCGAGGDLRIFAICFDLQFRWHMTAR